MGIFFYNVLLSSSILFYPVVKLATKKRGNISISDRFLTDFPQLKGKILLHLSSIGEVNSVKPLVKKLKDRLALTVFTDYGLERAKNIYPEVPSRILPFDLYPIVKKFLQKNKPEKILIYETEIWPSLLHCAGKLKIPTFIVSGKVSERSFKNYKNFKFFFKPLFKNVVFLARSQADADRAKSLGFKNVKIVGDLKFDVEKPESLSDLFIEGNRKVLIWGSTHQGEEKIAFELHEKLKGKFPNLLTIIAPRHIKRAKEIKIPSRYAFRSETKQITSDLEFYIVDTIGELSSLYRFGDVIVIGGSFVPNIGGHNPIEAALWKKPVVIGNFGTDFSEVAYRLKVPVLTVKELSRFVEKLLLDKRFYSELSETIFKSYQKEKGVTERILKAIGEEL
ncbi:3-deoxy-D-manno-octulosonic acid transferase [Desulfurobacterium thermolithotrophum]|uniref:3-deoxy-D-manno-octulosonic acid transferase n=1 Tax=Desulfurobacterium thermolithotrophum TaxID=64160 RepID=UPI0013D5EFD5|nr:glycosyltransferase N-terminal domain-containing protein [Desulfurobacterium thermolithotrophum]